MGKVDMGALRTTYQTDIAGGAKVTEAQARDLAKGAESAEGREYLEQRLETDTFDPKARTLLEKTISKNETSAEQAVDKATGLGPSGIAGTSAGKVGNIDITFKRELGSQGGFDSKEQARAAAVLNGKPAALVQDKSGRWHAGELSVDPKSMAGAFKAKGSTALVKIPAEADIQAAKDAFAKDGSAENYRKLVVASLGVDDGDVVLATDREPNMKFTPGKINVTMNTLDGGVAAGMTGYVKGKDSAMLGSLSTDDANPGTPTIVVGKGAENTKNLQDTYLHESTHQAHDARVKDIVGQWRTATKGKGYFDEWLINQHKAGKISDVDFKLAQQATNKPGGAKSPVTTATEALAYTKAFTNAYGNGVDVSGTKKGLEVTFDSLRGASEKKHEPPDQVKQEIGKELRQMYDGLSPAKQKEFRDYTAANFGGTWLKDYLPK
ncbi:MAG: hypothetical protein QM723_21170 [Myxococcaceae bacterium]